MRTRTIAAGLLLGGALMLAAPAFAQGDTPVAAEAAGAAEAAAAGEAGAQTPESFAKAKRLEEMRYKHVWIAYAAFWLIAFVFIFRTWRQSQATGRELDALKARLADLEARNGD